MKLTIIDERWINLLTEFDEMGFEPTTLPPKEMTVEEYTAFYKSRLLMCLTNARKQAVKEVLGKISNTPIKLSYGLDAKTVNIMTATLKDKIDEIAKEFGVEVEE